MKDGMNMLPMPPYIRLGSVALVCVLVFYLSQVTKTGYYAKFHFESFALTNETSTEGHQVNETTVSNVTLHKDDDPYKKLAEVLRKAANEDNTVILTVINKAFATPGSMLDLFLESFHAGENIEHMLNHLVLVAMDQNAHDRCQSLHPHCYFLRVEGADYNNEQRYATQSYTDMMWNRNMFQLKILELGFNFLFTDLDILWFRNPFKYISVEAHLAIATDRFDPFDQHMNSDINGGFLYAKSCNRTMEFYKVWLEGRERFTGINDQGAINRMKGELASRSKAYLQLLDTTYIGTFCQLKNDLNKICTVHANCCVGLDNKYHDLKVVFEDWKNFTAKSTDEKRSGEFHWTGPEKCKPWITR